MKLANHLISEHKIIPAFRITQRINSKKIDKIKDQIRSDNDSLSEKDLEKKLKEKITSSILSNVSPEDIPGIIIDEPTDQSDNQESNNKVDFSDDSVINPTKKSLLESFQSLEEDKKNKIIDLCKNTSLFIRENNFSVEDYYMFYQLLNNNLGITTKVLQKLYNKYRK